MFGLNSWSILVPQALEGVAAVGIFYSTIKRWFSPAAGLIAGAVLALTPVAALMFRYNNPDALLVLLLVIAAYATVRALERGSTWWLVLAGTCVGFGFITKMLQAFLVIPAIGLVYLWAGPPKLGRRILQLLAGGVAVVVAAGWWVAAVQLTPAADRPYIGGSQDNSLFNLVFGYNGFGRITGNETGSVGGGTSGTSQWGPTGWSRMFNSTFGTQASWLIPAALVALVAVLWLTRRAPRQDRTRAAFILWGGWLLVTAAVFSFAQGIIHPYYTVALAPAIGALVGMGAVELWRHRHQWFARAALAGATAAHRVVGLRTAGPHAGLVPVAAFRRAGVGHRGRRRHPGRPARSGEASVGRSCCSVSGWRSPVRSPSPSTPSRPRSPVRSRRPAPPAPPPWSAASAAPGAAAGSRAVAGFTPGGRPGAGGFTPPGGFGTGTPPSFGPGRPRPRAPAWGRVPGEEQEEQVASSTHRRRARRW